MSQWKTIVVTGIIFVLLLLVAGLGYKALNVSQSPTSPEQQALFNMKNRIEQYKVLKEEQTLTRDVMKLQQEIRELSLKAKVPPVIEGEFIPIDKLPPGTK